MRALAVVLTVVTLGWAELPPWIFGIHDPGGEYLMVEQGKTGWVVVTEEIGRDPDNQTGGDYSALAAAGHGVIVRLNHGYEPNGTIPLPEYYGDFATRCGNFVQNSTGCHIWIIGNEPNLAVEWPGGDPIYPDEYVACFLACRAEIRSRPGHESDWVLPAGIGTYAAGSPPVCVGDWIQYWIDMLNGIGTNCEGLVIHTYTHGTDPALIFSDAKMAPPYDDRYYHFRAYINYMETIPPALRDRPVFITETDQIESWADVNSGWVKNAYLEINNWNQVPGNQKIWSVCLYRWQPWDTWCWQYKEGVKQDFREACQNDYRYNPEPPEPDDAVFLSHTVPAAMAADSSTQVSIRVRNVGTQTWSGSGEANPYRLGAGSVATGNPEDNDFLWSGFANGGYSNSLTDQRAYLGGTVAPQGEATFTFTITAPSTPGTYHFEARMVHDGVAWFGPCLSVPVVVYEQSENLLVNGGFELGDMTGWTTWGQAEGAKSGTFFGGITARSGTYFQGNAANWGAKSGGFYQRVAVTEGATYVARGYSNLYWIGGSSWNTRSRIGIDPEGGTSPSSPSIVWSPWHTHPVESEASGWTLMEVSAESAAPQITVFVEFVQDSVPNPPGGQWHVNCFDDIELVGPPAPQTSWSPPGWLVAGWNMVSVPYEPVDPSAYAVFDHCGSLYNQLFLYVPGAGYGYYPGDFTEVHAGVGYWLKLTAAVSEDVVGHRVGDPAPVPLEAGWNLVGHPQDGDVALSACSVTDGIQTLSFAEAGSAGWIQPVMYCYVPGSGYQSQDAGSGVLVPWRGYWLKAMRSGLTLLVPGE